MNEPEIPVVSATRTAIGRFGGTLKDGALSQLPSTAVCEIIARADTRGSGLQAIISAAQTFLLGDAEIAIGGGAESMSRGPCLLPAARRETRMGEASMTAYVSAPMPSRPSARDSRTSTSRTWPIHDWSPARAGRRRAGDQGRRPRDRRHPAVTESDLPGISGRGRCLRHDGQAPAADPCATRRVALATSDPFARAMAWGAPNPALGTRQTVTLTLREDPLNFMASCHGGVVFALADTAFASAANPHGRVAAGIDAQISYQHAARQGQIQVARAFDTAKSCRLGFYRVDVAPRDGPLVSTFSGTVSIET